MLRISLLFTLLLPGAILSQAQTFQAGSAIADTTPTQWPQNLVGGFTPVPCETANDPLSARAFAFRNGEGRVVIATVDACVASREVLDECKARAAEATGWKTSEMMISSTHTHSAPSPSAEMYRETFVNGTSQALIEAIRDLKLARIGYGEGAVPEEVFNRRWFLEEGKMPPNPFGELDQVKMNPNRNHITKPAGPTDPTVAVLDIRDSRNRPIGIYANYPLHYIGGTALVTMPFEVLVEIGLEIKEKSPFPNTIFVSLANGAFGYLPTPEQHALGGYETWLGTCRVEPESSEILTEHLLEMLAELHGE